VKHVLFVLFAACGGGGGFPDGHMPDTADPGTFALSWTLTDMNANPLTCAAASATLVNVSVVDSATSAQYGGSFDCTLGTTVIGPLFTASYDITFEVLGAAGKIATAPEQTGVVTPDQTTQLDPIVFVIPS